MYAEQYTDDDGVATSDPKIDTSNGGFDRVASHANANKDIIECMKKRMKTTMNAWYQKYEYNRERKDVNRSMTIIMKTTRNTRER